MPLNEFDVSFKPGEPAALLNTTWDEQEANRWSLKEITLAPDYTAALAVEASNYSLNFGSLIVYVISLESKYFYHRDTEQTEKGAREADESEVEAAFSLLYDKETKRDIELRFSPVHD
ncbi:hypothetical protein NIES4071_33180 [Calothrix sp. NIES-4071]|nr:hypothetical protein NIES4071_33180 [Calothrix sp. NIES-4071]BAZ57637.1 hypothetical protein NIES4105_33110 [Calothrix sp. NIES-4105]